MSQDLFLSKPWQQITTLATLVLMLWISGCSADAQSVDAQASLEAPVTPWPHGAMVSAANPLAVDAGIKMLELGGNAVDAAIATHLVLGLVEPQSSGLGGGAFFLHFDRAQNQTTFLDGRESAPASATPDLFMTEDGVMGYLDAWQSGKAVGTPGTVRSTTPPTSARAACHGQRSFNRLLNSQATALSSHLGSPITSR